jgi:C-1 hydroxylase
MSVEENKAIVRRVIETVDKLSLEGLDAVVAPEILQQWEKGIAWSRETFPGHRIQITDMVAEGDKVWVRVATSGGYAGGWMDIPATDKQWSNTGVGFYRFSGGKIVEYEQMFNRLGHLQQLGAKVVPSEPGGE